MLGSGGRGTLLSVGRASSAWQSALFALARAVSVRLVHQAAHQTYARRIRQGGEVGGLRREERRLQSSAFLWSRVKPDASAS
jgi:hypothetical protein